MKIAEGFKIRSMLGVNIVVGEGIKRVNFNKIISLNESAAYLWEKVVGIEFTADTLASLLEEQYEVDHETALADSKKIAQDWIDAGIVEE